MRASFLSSSNLRRFTTLLAAMPTIVEQHKNRVKLVDLTL
jgi:hypothetical protein